MYPLQGSSTVLILTWYVTNDNLPTSENPAVVSKQFESERETNPQRCVKILGPNWNYESDEIMYDLSELLSFAARDRLSINFMDLVTLHQRGIQQFCTYESSNQMARSILMLWLPKQE